MSDEYEDQAERLRRGEREPAALQVVFAASAPGLLLVTVLLLVSARR